MTDQLVYPGIFKNILHVVKEKDVGPSRDGKETFLSAIALSNPSFQQITVDSPFEMFFGNGDQDAVEIFSGIVQKTISQARTVSPFPVFQQVGDVCLAGQSFLLRKCVAQSSSFHFPNYVVPDITPKPLQRKGFQESELESLFSIRRRSWP